MWKDELEFYDSLIANNPNFERKGKNMVYTSANGYMFSQLNKAGEIGIRLPKSVAAKFMEDFNTGEFRSYGAKMKDYVLVPRSLYNQTTIIDQYLQMSYEYVMSLPPK